MKIVLVGNYPRNDTHVMGGIQASTFGLCHALLSQRLVQSITVLAIPTRPTRRISECQKSEELDIVYLDTPICGTTISVLKRVFWAWRRAAVDSDTVVHIHGSGLFQAAFSIICQYRKVPTVWTVHGIARKEVIGKLRRQRSPRAFVRLMLYASAEWLQRYCAQHIIVDTDYVRNALSLHSRSIHVIPQGVFLFEFADRCLTPTATPLVLSIGVLEERKGHHYLLDAFVRVLKAIPNANLVIIGAEAEPHYRVRLQQQIANLRLDEQVQLLSNLSHEQVLGYIFRAHMFTLHSEEELQGIAICEAMAAGLPILSTKVGGIPDVVSDGVTGVLTEFGAVEEFARKMVCLLNDERLRSQLGGAAKHRARDFNWLTISCRVAEVYRVAAGQCIDRR